MPFDAWDHGQSQRSFVKLQLEDLWTTLGNKQQVF